MAANPMMVAPMDAPIADRILISLVRPHVIDGVSLNVSASIGVGQWPADGASADDLFEFADRALYQAKDEARFLGPASGDLSDPVAASA